MSRLFRNSSPGALTREQAVALMKERIAPRAGGSAGHDVSNEPRVPRGNGDDSGQWTTDGAAPSSGNSAEISTGCPKGYDIVEMEVTAYTNGPESTGKRPRDPGYGETKHRTKTKPGTLAAPWSYDYDTKMYVPGYGWGSVQDRGAAIKGIISIYGSRQWKRPSDGAVARSR